MLTAAGRCEHPIAAETSAICSPVARTASAQLHSNTKNVLLRQFRHAARLLRPRACPIRRCGVSKGAVALPCAGSATAPSRPQACHRTFPDKVPGGSGSPQTPCVATWLRHFEALLDMRTIRASIATAWILPEHSTLIGAING